MHRDAVTSTTPSSTTAEANSGVGTEAAAKGAAVRKREDYISWDDYFMGVAFLSAMRSKDPSTQVGACLVDGENKIVGIGAWCSCWSPSPPPSAGTTTRLRTPPTRLPPTHPSPTTKGYNGFPRGCSDDALPWARTATAPGDSGFLDTKYAYVCHAEMNAILNRNIAPLHGPWDACPGTVK